MMKIGLKTIARFSSYTTLFETKTNDYMYILELI